MRVRSTLTGLTLAATGLGLLVLLPARAADAPSTKLYLHSANGSYLDDWSADPGRSPDSITFPAPEGSTMSAAAPTGATDATGLSVGGSAFSGYPNAPTFALPVTGSVKTACLDLYVEAPAAPQSTLAISLRVWPAGVGSVGTFPNLVVAEYPPANGGVVRMTGLVTLPAAVDLRTGSTAYFVAAVTNPAGVTVHYDSTARPSSVTFNPATCEGAPAPSTSPSPGGSGSPTPTPSPSPSGSVEPSTPPSETPFVEPTGCVTPAGGGECVFQTTTTYTGATRARYADTVTLAARVLTRGGAPATGGVVAFTLHGTTYRAEVNAQGVASTRARIAKDPELYILEVTYEGTPTYAASGEQAGFTVTKTAAACHLTRGVTSTQSRLVAILTNPDGSRIAGTPVTFRHNGRNLARRNTDGSGVARYDTVRGNPGDTFEVRFDGDARHTACSRAIRA